MSDDPLTSLARAAAQDRDDAFRKRVQKERRIQTTARRVRKTLRWSILGLTVLGFSLFYFGAESIGSQVLGFFCFLLVVVLGYIVKLWHIFVLGLEFLLHLNK